MEGGGEHCDGFNLLWPKLVTYHGNRSAELQYCFCLLLLVVVYETRLITLT